MSIIKVENDEKEEDKKALRNGGTEAGIGMGRISNLKIYLYVFQSKHSNSTFLSSGCTPQPSGPLLPAH